MSFFVTSVGIGKGGDLGGLAGADAHCQRLAAAVGAGGKTWRAYLSTQARPGEPAVNARDRIGRGPWHNSKKLPIAADLAELNGDTIELARLGSNLFKQSALNEKGELINGAGDTPNMHDMLTGSQTDGRAYTDSADHTGNNWTRQQHRLRPGRPFRPHRRRQHLVELGAPDPRLQPGGAGEHRRGGLVLLLRDQLKLWKKVGRAACAGELPRPEGERVGVRGFRSLL
jgi:hypothetical protein